MSSDSTSSTIPNSSNSLIPVAKEDIGEIWESLDVEDVLRFADGELDSSDLYSAVREGRSYQLWLYPGGWVVTNIWSDWIDLVAWKDISRGTLSGDVVAFFQATAEKLNFRGIRFVTLRNPTAVLRRASPFGFETRMIEYIKKNDSYTKEEG